MSAPALILGFDTSGAYLSAALFDGNDICAAAYEEMARGQAERLVPLLEEVLAQGGADWGDLSALGVGIGPGNFTGIRLSVSCARGLALGLGIPAVGVSLLDALALDMPGPVLAALSAPRGSAYVQSRGMIADIPAQQVALEAIPADWAQEGLTIIGSAGADIAGHLGARHAPAAHAPGPAIARIAARRWRDNPPRPAPFYLRAADAAPPRDAPPVILDDA